MQSKKMLRAVAEYTAPFIQRVPQIGKMRGGLELMLLVGETWMRYRQNRIPAARKSFGVTLIHSGCIGFFRSAQIIACLGSTRFFKWYLVSVPASTMILEGGMIYPFLVTYFRRRALEAVKKVPALSVGTTVINSAFLIGNIGSKLVNSFAIGLLAQRILSEDPTPGAVMVIATSAALALSAWNIYKGWNDTALNDKTRK